MDDCMAAMVLMSLSCSPKSPIFPPDGVTFPGSWSSFDSGLTTNSTASRSNSPSPPVDAKSDGIEIHVQRNKSLKRVSSFDEGIDESLKFEEDFEDSGQHHRRVLFRCTWPGCSQLSNDCEDIERHVRVKHLGRSEDSLEDETSDHEEEFYYTEIEMHESDECPSPFSSSSLLTSHGIFPSSLPHSITTTAMPVGGQSPLQSPGPLVESDSLPFFGSSSAPTWSHLDMVRPPHEDPEYKKYLVTTEKPEKSKSNLASSESPKCLISHPINIPGISFAQHYARPLNLSSPKAANYNNANKYMRLNGNSKSGTTLLQSPSKLTTVSPTRRTRGETRKCRKQYGMENRDSWCTQCKWKKACSRFVD